MNNNLRTDTPTGFDQTPATPTPGSPLTPWTFDRLFAKVFSYQERTALHPEDTYLDLSGMYSLTELVYGVLPDDLTELIINRCPLLEIDCALLPKTLEALDLENCEHLERVLNIDQLPKLTVLNLSNTAIRSLSKLPESLRHLRVHHCGDLRSLPSLGRTNLQTLEMDWTFTELPQIPETLMSLSARHSGIGGELPYLPDGLIRLDVVGSVAEREGFLPERLDTVNILEYSETARKWWNACLRRERYDQIHEELMAATWHPRRVEAWLTAGEEVLDMMMGC